MSQQLISRSPDLKRLQDEGYEIEIRSNRLVMHHVPYVNTERECSYGTLVTDLELSGDATSSPVRDHVVRFAGSVPCDQKGTPLNNIIAATAHEKLDDRLEVDFTFSSKPPGGYGNYYEKMTTYIAILGAYAVAIDPDATATTFPVIETAEGDSVFLYLDTASSRAGIDLVTKRLELAKVAIVGIGGTGSYILDLVAKTPVMEIHLFDGDVVLQHNAFRCPGASSIEDLRGRPTKVQYFHGVYSRMRRGIVPHSYYVDDTNADELLGFDFVFLSLDKGSTKRSLVAKLEQASCPFVDVGMGVEENDGSLSGLLRITTSTPRKHDHVATRIPFSDGDDRNDYDRNIQIADLNALNASLAVIRWKKHFGFYADLEHEHFSLYQIDGNEITNEECG